MHSSIFTYRTTHQTPSLKRDLIALCISPLARINAFLLLTSSTCSPTQTLKTLTEKEVGSYGGSSLEKASMEPMTRERERKFVRHVVQISFTSLFALI